MSCGEGMNKRQNMRRKAENGERASRIYLINWLGEWWAADPVVVQIVGRWWVVRFSYFSTLYWLGLDFFRLNMLYKVWINQSLNTFNHFYLLMRDLSSTFSTRQQYFEHASRFNTISFEWVQNQSMNRCWHRNNLTGVNIGCRKWGMSFGTDHKKSYYTPYPPLNDFNVCVYFLLSAL